MKYRIIELPAFDVVGMDYRGSAPGDSIGQLWQRFLPREKEVSASAQDTAAYGVCSQLPDGEFHYIAGLPVEPGANVPAGMTRYGVPAQKYAVFTHIGPVTAIADSFQAIYSSLLARHGLEPKKGVDLERYTERFLGPEDPASETDLYVPIY
ncbi:GyrI-like domain-containing protein [Pseudomonas nitroreducens]|uniref:AraC family transcriptional regulator n=1 Tax=Pseudomonas nitroreducens TaxID=46680 RepID=A0A6G6J4D5_PSENT|nr:GyrI-like domain-containing protein [Pseudomonas nitroreducens]QIE90097.1 AraC family transcriptional regulator [Pseudomonas nitroreducens]